MSDDLQYSVEFSREADRALERLDKPIRQRVRLAIDELASNPRPHGYLKMTGYTNRFRIRIGDWRVVYEIVDEILVVIVVKVAKRGDVYR